MSPSAGPRSTSIADTDGEPAAAASISFSGSDDAASSADDIATPAALAKGGVGSGGEHEIPRAIANVGACAPGGGGIAHGDNPNTTGVVATAAAAAVPAVAAAAGADGANAAPARRGADVARGSAMLFLIVDGRPGALLKILKSILPVLLRRDRRGPADTSWAGRRLTGRPLTLSGSPRHGDAAAGIIVSHQPPLSPSTSMSTAGDGPLFACVAPTSGSTVEAAAAAAAASIGSVRTLTAPARGPPQFPALSESISLAAFPAKNISPRPQAETAAADNAVNVLSSPPPPPSPPLPSPALPRRRASPPATPQSPSFEAPLSMLARSVAALALLLSTLPR